MCAAAVHPRDSNVAGSHLVVDTYTPKLQRAPVPPRPLCNLISIKKIVARRDPPTNQAGRPPTRSIGSYSWYVPRSCERVHVVCVCFTAGFQLALIV